MKKKLFAAVLALSMVLTLLPVSALAADIDDGTQTGSFDLSGVEVEEITQTLTKTGDTTNIDAVIALSGKMSWSSERAAGNGSTARPAGWWAGVKITIPTAADASKVKYRANGDTADKNFTDYRDGENYITVWGGIQESWLTEYSDKTSYTFKWFFNWDGADATGTTVTLPVGGDMTGVDQVISLTLNLKSEDGECVQLMDESGKNVMWPYSSISVEEDGTVDADAVKDAVTAAEGSEDKTVTITAEAAESEPAEVTLPSEAIASVAEADGVSLTIAAGTEAEPLTVTLDNGAVDAVRSAAGSNDVTISAKKATEADTDVLIPEDVEVDATYVVEVKANGVALTEDKWTGSQITLTVPAIKKNAQAVAAALIRVYLDGKRETGATVELEEETLKVTVPHLTAVSLVAGSVADYAVTIPSSIENGTVTSNKETAEANDTVTLTVNPDNGYEIGTVTVTGADGTTTIHTTAGTAAADGTPYTFTMPAQAVTVNVTFTPVAGPQYTIQFAAGDGTGTKDDVTVNKAATGVTEYELPECTFTAPEGKVFDTWTVAGDGLSIEDGKLTIADTVETSAEITLTATWKDAPTIADTGLKGQYTTFKASQDSPLADGYMTVECGTLKDNAELGVADGNTYLIQLVAGGNCTLFLTTADENGLKFLCNKNAVLTIWQLNDVVSDIAALRLSDIQGKQIITNLVLKNYAVVEQ